MSKKTRHATVQVALATGPETQEFLAELMLDLGLLVKLLHGRISERETCLALQVSGDPAGVREGILRCKDRSGRSPFLVRAS